MFAITYAVQETAKMDFFTPSEGAVDIMPQDGKIKVLHQAGFRLLMSGSD
jgi:hypothetical protein